MNAERLASMAWFVFGGATAYTAWGHGLGEGGEPGSGFVAFIAGLFVCAMAAIIYGQSYFNPQVNSQKISDLWQGVIWTRSLIIVALSLAFIWLIDILGYFVTSVLLLAVIMRYLEKLSWSKSLLIPFLSVLATYLLFTSLLDTNMPRGVLGLW